MKFNKSYTNYWASAVKNSIDGTVIPDINVADFFFQSLEAKKEDVILDLGCSYGRMSPLLQKYSEQVYGIDPDSFAVKQAKTKPYKDVQIGAAENTGFDDNFFDIVFCWAVFDVIDHSKGLKEIYRILKNGGSVLFTGKNYKYFSDDLCAFKAEKNAFLKGFPGKFTKLDNLLVFLEKLGFKLKKFFIFPRRGDFGQMEFIEYTPDNAPNAIGYEYLIVCQKIIDKNNKGTKSIPKLSESYSSVVFDAAFNSGYKDTALFLRSIGLD